MDGNPVAPGDVAHDRVSRDGIAAFGQLHHDVVLPFHQDPVAALVGLHGLGFQLAEELGQVLGGGLALGLLVQVHQFHHDPVDHQSAISQGCQKVLHAAVHMAPGSHFLQVVRGEHGVHIVAQAPAFPFQHLPAVDDVLFPPFLFEELLDLVLGLAGSHDIDPVTAGAGRLFGRDDLYDVPVLQVVIQGNDLPVHLGPHAAVAHSGMDPVGEIDGDGAFRQVQHIPLGSEHEHLVGKHVHLHGIHEFMGIPHILMPFQQLPQPGHLGIHALIGRTGHLGAAAFLIPPVGCHPVFRDLMHLEGPDLDFQGLSARSHHRGMEGLVAVGFGHGDVIFEPARDGFPFPMDDAQDPVAVLHRIHQHPDGQEIVDFVDGLMVPLHLLVDAVEALGTALDLAVDAGFLTQLPEFVHGFLDHGFPFVPLDLDLFHQFIVMLGFHVPESQIFQFPFDGVDPQPVGQGRVDFQGFRRDPFLLVHRHVFHGPHVVQPVRQFDQDHPDVLGHGQEHFPVVLHLLFFPGDVFDLSQFGDPVHQHGHFPAEDVLQLVQGHIRIFHHIMQEGSGQRHIVHLELSQDRSHSQRMDDIGFPGSAFLLGMGFRREVVGFPDEFHLPRGQIFADAGVEFFRTNRLIIELFHCLTFLWSKARRFLPAAASSCGSVPGNGRRMPPGGPGTPWNPAYSCVLFLLGKPIRLPG